MCVSFFSIIIFAWQAIQKSFVYMLSSLFFVLFLHFLLPAVVLTLKWCQSIKFTHQEEGREKNEWRLGKPRAASSLYIFHDTRVCLSVAFPALAPDFPAPGKALAKICKRVYLVLPLSFWSLCVCKVSLWVVRWAAKCEEKWAGQLGKLGGKCKKHKIIKKQKK